MPQCITCERTYERDGGILLNICDDCLAAPKAPDSYRAVSGILVPNPAYEEWKSAEAERIQNLRNING